MRPTIRSCTAERGPWAGRADGYVAGRERSQGKLGRHLLAEAPRSAAWQPIGAIEISPATFDGKPRRCGARVGVYWEVTGCRSTVRGVCTPAAGGPGGRRPRSERLRRAIFQGRWGDSRVRNGGGISTSLAGALSMRGHTSSQHYPKSIPCFPKPYQTDQYLYRARQGSSPGAGRHP